MKDVYNNVREQYKHKLADAIVKHRLATMNAEELEELNNEQD